MSLDFHMKTPTVIQYNLDVQQQLAPSLSVPGRICRIHRI